MRGFRDWNTRQKSKSIPVMEMLKPNEIGPDQKSPVGVI
jgi:hypothetical protein